MHRFGLIRYSGCRVDTQDLVLDRVDGMGGVDGAVECTASEASRAVLSIPIT